MLSKKKQINVTAWLLFGAVIHLLTAYFSEGHTGPSERLLEFLNFKLGVISLNELSGEFADFYNNKSSSSILVFLYYHVTKFLSLCGIERPFYWTFTFRLMAALAGQLAVILLCKYSFRYFKLHWQQKWSVILLNIAWFLPFIHTRISQEALSGSILILGLMLILLGFYGTYGTTDLSSRRSLTIGTLLGLAFLLQFQIFFILISFFCWMLLIRKPFFLKTYCLIFLGGFCAMILGVLVDFWGYGEWTFTPWNFVVESYSMINNGDFAYPRLWYYPYLIFKAGIPPLGLICMISFLWLWLSNPAHEFTWITFPYVVLLIVSGHKMLNDLYPIATFTPIVVVMMVTFIARLIYGTGKVAWAFKNVLLFVNCCLLILIVIMPADVSIDFYRYTYDLKNPFTKVYLLDDYDPFSLNRRSGNFYVTVRPAIEKIDSLQELVEQNKKMTVWVFASRSEGHHKISSSNICLEKYLTYPKWAYRNQYVKKWLNKVRMLSLYKCNIDMPHMSYDQATSINI